MLGACGMSVTLICQVPRKPNLNLSMTALKERKTIVLALDLIIVSITGIIGLGIPRVHAVGTGTGGIGLGAVNCGSSGLVPPNPCQAGITTQTDTTLFGSTVKTDTHIKFVNTTNAVSERWAAPKGIVYDTNLNGKYDSLEPVLYGSTPAVGTTLSCATATSCATSRDVSIQRFVGPGATWASGNTAFQDAGTNGATAPNNKYDWGEFVYTGPVPASSASVSR